MIISEDVKIKLNLPISNEQIENALKERNIDFLRWSITDVDENIFTIRLSHIVN